MSENPITPYHPSWIDCFMNWIKDRPGPSWSYYAGIGVFLLALLTVTSWIEGAVPFGAFNPVHVFLAAAIPFIVASISHFDERAISALKTIKPVLTTGEEEYQQMGYVLTNLRQLPALLAGIVAIILVFVTEFIGDGAYYVVALVGYPASTTLSRVIYLICWWFFGIFVFHTMHQLRWINHIYSQHTSIDLFRMKPLYDFSNLTALTAGSLVVLPYGFLLVNPTLQLTNSVVVGIYMIISAIALATFFIPQLGIHRLQEEEKERLKWEINRRYLNAVDVLHRRVDEEEFDDVATIGTALDILGNERKTIIGISTWPWQPETIRWLFTAIVLPLLIWVAQYFLGKWLTP